MSRNSMRCDPRYRRDDIVSWRFTVRAIPIDNERKLADQYDHCDVVSNWKNVGKIPDLRASLVMSLAYARDAPG